MSYPDTTLSTTLPNKFAAIRIVALRTREPEVLTISSSSLPQNSTCRAVLSAFRRQRRGIFTQPCCSARTQLTRLFAVPESMPGPVLVPLPAPVDAGQCDTGLLRRSLSDAVAITLTREARPKTHPSEEKASAAAALLPCRCRLLSPASSRPRPRPHQPRAECPFETTKAAGTGMSRQSSILSLASSPQTSPA